MRKFDHCHHEDDDDDDDDDGDDDYDNEDGDDDTLLSFSVAMAGETTGLPENGEGGVVGGLEEM